MSGRKPVDQTKLRGNLAKLPFSMEQLIKNFVSPNKNNSPIHEKDVRNKINQPKLKKLSDAIANNINAATDLRQITPYISKAELIWKTLLLYPNGIQRDILTYTTNPSSIKNVKMHDELIKILSEYFTNSYKIESELPDMVGDVLFGTGSYITLNISRPALDHLINGAEVVSGNESLRTSYVNSTVKKHFTKDEVTGNYRAKNFGLVKNPSIKDGLTVGGIEGLFTDGPKDSGTEFNLFNGSEALDVFGAMSGITVSDNPVILSINTLTKLRNQPVINQVAGSEDYQGLINQIISSKQPKPVSFKQNKKDKGSVPQANTSTNILGKGQLEAIQNSLYPDRSYQNQPFQSIRSQDSYSTPVFGTPLRYKVPSEACILVHANNNPKKHKGAFLLLDANGEFVKMTMDASYYQSERKDNNMGGGGNGNADESGSMNSLISSLRKVQEGKSADFDMSEFAALTNDLVERSLIAACVSGQGESVSVEIQEDALKIMMARMFKHEVTRVLYVPIECLSYLALSYDKLGIGQSLTNQAKNFIARLAAMDIADAIANLELAQPHNLMEISIEKEDPDYQNTVAQARAQWFATNPTIHDMISGGYLSIPDITDALKEQTLTVKVVSGDNAQAPGPDINISQVEKNGFRVVDDASRQNLLNNIANTFGLDKNWLDVTGDGNNFQVEALAEQELLRNRTIMWQAQLAEGIIDIIKKHAVLNKPLLESLIRVISNNEKLMKPDNGVKLLGGSVDKINTVLKDFLNNIVVTLPSPSSTESTNKLKDKIQSTNDLVEAWVAMSGGEKIMKTMLLKAGYDEEQLNEEQISETLKGIYLIAAYKKFNIPMPFDDILNQGKEGGIYSLTDHMEMFGNNIALFLSKYMQASDKTNDFLNKELKKVGVTKESAEDLGADDPSDDLGEEPTDGGNEELPDDGDPVEEPDVDDETPEENKEDDDSEEETEAGDEEEIKEEK